MFSDLGSIKFIVTFKVIFKSDFRFFLFRIQDAETVNVGVCDKLDAHNL